MGPETDRKRNRFQAGGQHRKGLRPECPWNVGGLCSESETGQGESSRRGGEGPEDHVIQRTRAMALSSGEIGSQWRTLSRGVTRSDTLCDRITLAALLRRLWRGTKVAAGRPVRKLNE